MHSRDCTIHERDRDRAALLVNAVDVAIVGAGPVGASLALALRDARLRVALIDAAPAAPQVVPAADWDSRIWALNPTSVAFLGQIGVWPLLDSLRVERCVGMRVAGDRGTALEFNAYDARVEALAFMLEARALSRALAIQLAAASHVTRVVGQPVRLDRDASVATITLDSGESIAASVIVGADGGESWVRSTAGIVVDEYDYHAQGVVANFRCERPHHGVAYQWFRRETESHTSILAYLPLPRNMMSMVWSTSDAHARTLLSLPEDALTAQVTNAGERVLGALQITTPARSFPLKRVSPRSIVDDRIALVGDAAHVIHPLAGQGVNLGFGDAQSLARIIVGREVFRDPGDARVLARYKRDRAEAILAMRTVTHGLERLFAQPGAAAQWVRSTGLAVTDRLVVIKNLLARHALG